MPRNAVSLAALAALIAALSTGVPAAHAAPRAASSPVASASAPTGTAESRWESTLANVSQAVVAIRVAVPRAFDTESATSALATGFVVDAERGILLTNRHVVQPGPVVAEAVFNDHEEVPLVALYRDPVHDFGFYAFDPAALKHQAVVALPLAPQGAKVGVDIRVVGNDAGEKLSFLPGILARLDRDAPTYGKGYNDFNTFYLQAASGTSGGSSGSPVVDIDGRVIGLNAGGRTNAATSYYLPLDRVVRALGLVQAGQAVSRGTWQAVLSWERFDELRRLGLRAATEDAARAAAPDASGMLVVSEVVPGGPAAGQLLPGDVVVRVDGAAPTGFVDWEGRLDERVGKKVHVEVERGGRPLTFDLDVGDLWALTPSSFLEIGGGVLHTLSFQLARNFGVPVQGVYVATAGTWLSRVGVPEGSVIYAAEGKPVASLSDLEAVLSTLPEGAPVRLSWFQLRELAARRVATPVVTRRWFPIRHCTRDDASGTWPCTDLPSAPGVWSPPIGTATLLDGGGGPGGVLAPSLVWITFNAPIRPEGLYGDRFIGTGLILDAERGLVLTDRDTVPITAGDVTLTFGASLDVPARVVFVHPFHNLAIVQYDPALVGATPVRAIRWSRHALEPGASTWVVGLARSGEVVSSPTSVSTRALLETVLPEPPYFRDRNVDVLDVGDGGRAVGGVLADKHGAVMGLWANFVDASRDPWSGFHRGLPGDFVQEAIAPFLAGSSSVGMSLGAELDAISLVTARELGLGDDAVNALARAGGAGRRAFQVRRVDAGSPAAAVLAGGDVLIAADGVPVTSPDQVERAVTRAPVSLSVLRGGAVQTVVVTPFVADGAGPTRFLVWGGALLQTTPLPAAQQRGVPATGVYVSWLWHGSPAHQYGLWPTRRIVAVDDVPVGDLDQFVAAVAGRTDRAPVRLRVRALDGKESVITLKLDLRYWPTAEIARDADGGWTRRAIPVAPARPVN